MILFFITLIEQILAFYPAVMGIYIAYRLLKITDLSADGSYVLGASVYAYFLNIMGPWGAMLMAFLSGSLSGTVLSFMQKKHRVHPLIAGILMTFMLYSVNFEILGLPNLSLFGQETLLSISIFSQWMSVLILINAGFFIYLYFLMRSPLGLGIRAFGTNPYLMDRFGLKPELYRWAGLACAGSCYASAGALFAQVYGFVDLGIGNGVSLIALAAVILGEKLSPFLSQDVHWILRDLFGVFVGISSYFMSLQFFMSLGFEPIHLKLFVGIVLYTIMQGQSPISHNRGEN